MLCSALQRVLGAWRRVCGGCLNTRRRASARPPCRLAYLALSVGFEGFRFDFVKASKALLNAIRTLLPPGSSAALSRLPAVARAVPLPQGYAPHFVKQYIEATIGPDAFSVGEYFPDLR